MLNIKNTLSQDKLNLLSNFFSLTSLQGFNYLLPFLTLPYLVNVLGVEKYGLVIFAQSFIVFFNIIVDFGFNLSATREISIHRDSRDKVTEIYSSVMLIKLFLTLASFLVLLFIVFTFNKFNNEILLYFISFLMVIGQALFPIWYFQGHEKMKYITFINILSKLIFTIAVFLFVKEKTDYLLVPLFNGIGVLCGSLYAIYIIRKDFNQKIILQELKTIKYYFNQSSQFFLSRVSVSIYTAANSFVLGIFTNNTMVGYYSVAEKMYLAIQSPYTPLTQVLYPYISKNKNILFFKKIFYITIIFNVLFVLLMYFSSEFIFNLLFDSNITNESLQVFNFFLIANLVVVPSILLGYPFLAALGFSKYANMSVIFGSIFHLSALLTLILINRITLFNIAVLVIITESLVFFLRMYWVNYKKNMEKVILTYGTFDLFHVGHLNLLNRLRGLGDKLIVGVSTDDFNLQKGKSTIIPYEQRAKIVQSLKCVDIVIPESSWDQKIIDVKKYQVSVFAMGDDWEGKFDFLNEYCEVVYLKRTKDISSTQIKDTLNSITKVKDDFLKAIEILEQLKKDFK